MKTLAAALLFALLPSRAAAGVLYDLGNGASTATLRLTGPLRLVGSKTTLSTYRFDLDPVLSHVKKSSANGTVEFEVTKYGVINSTTQPAARWLRTTALSTADSANVSLTFPSREYNTQSLFAVSAATIPVGGAGLYRVGCSAEFANDSDGRRAVWAAKGGTVITGCKTMAPAVASDVTIVVAGCTPYLAEGDVITCNTFHSAGNALNVESASIEVVKLW